MLELDDFDSLYEYVKQHHTNELLEPILRYELLFYNCDSVDIIPYPDLKEELNKRTLEKYNLAIGSKIESQILDLKNNIEEYAFLYNNILMDDISKNILFNILLYRLTYAGKYIAKAYCKNSVQYFDEKIVRYRNNCIFVDCGGFIGDTAIEFLLNCRYYKHIYIYEPIKKFYFECDKIISELDIKNVTIKNSAVYNKNTILYFEENIPGSSRVNNDGNIQVNSVSLDEDILESIDFIKMDIEGSEQKAIEGARGHIQKDFPMLAICVYHLADDIWKIPKMIYEMRTDYIFYLRHYTLSTDETVLYAVPNNVEKKDIYGDQYYKYLKKKEIDERDHLASMAAYFQEQYENYYINSFEYRRELVKLQEWARELENAKKYLLGQVEDYKKDNEKKQEIIIGLEGWTKELENAKEYLLGQVKDYKKDDEKKQEIIIELEGWTKELENAKQYLEGQLNNIKKVNSELQSKINQMEEELLGLNNENKKLQYKYNRLLNDPIIKKIMKIKKYEP